MVVNTTTWAITTATAATTDIGGATTTLDGELIPIDTNHFLFFYTDNSNDGQAQVLTVNTTTWAITTSAAKLEFDTQKGTYCSVDQYDATHFVVAWN